MKLGGLIGFSVFFLVAKLRKRNNAEDLVGFDSVVTRCPVPTKKSWLGSGGKLKVVNFFVFWAEKC